MGNDSLEKNTLSNEPNIQEVDMSYFFNKLPGEIRELIIGNIKNLQPQRKTDIWYEDDDKNIWIMRKGNEYILPEESGIVWQLIDSDKTVKDICTEISKKYNESDVDKISKFVTTFLLNAHVLDIVILYPKEFVTTNLSTGKKV